MGILDGILSPLLTQTANARGAYLSGERQAQEKGIANALAQLKAKREADSASITDALHRAQTAKALQLPKPVGKQMKIAPNGTVYAYDPTTEDLEEITPKAAKPPLKAGGVNLSGTGSSVTDALTHTVGPSSEAGDQGAPSLTESPIQAPTQAPAQAPKPFAKAPKFTRVAGMLNGKADFAMQDEQGNLVNAVTHLPFKAGEFTPTQHESGHFTTYGDTGPDGKSRTMRLNTQTGETQEIGGGKAASGGAGSAPMAAKVGQFGEMLKKYQDLVGASENLDVSVGQSAASDIAQHGLGFGKVLRVPGTKGVGSLLVNQTPQYAQYKAALAPFILAAAHALSGARINQDQVEQIRQSIELAPGDFSNPTVRAQKEKNLIDLINSIGGSLPEAAIVAQENQMDPKALEQITGRGYRRRVPPTRRSTDTKSSGDAEFDALMAKVKKP